MSYDRVCTGRPYAIDLPGIDDQPIERIVFVKDHSPIQDGGAVRIDLLGNQAGTWRGAVLIARDAPDRAAKRAGVVEVLGLVDCGIDHRGSPIQLVIVVRYRDRWRR